MRRNGRNLHVLLYEFELPPSQWSPCIEVSLKNSFGFAVGRDKLEKLRNQPSANEGVGPLCTLSEVEHEPDVSQPIGKLGLLCDAR